MPESLTEWLHRALAGVITSPFETQAAEEYRNCRRGRDLAARGPTSERQEEKPNRRKPQGDEKQWWKDIDPVFTGDELYPP